MLVIDVAVIHRQRILLVDYKGICWILPGGTLESGEDDLICLVREVHEEIGLELPLEDLFYLGEFGGFTHDGKSLTVRLYVLFMDVQAFPKEGKIRSARWSSVREALALNLSAMTRQIVFTLEQKGYL